MSKSSDADARLRQDASRASPAAGGPERAPQNRSTERAERERTPGRRHLTIASVALLLFAVVSAATGQVMLKHGMQIASARAGGGGGLVGARGGPPA